MTQYVMTTRTGSVVIKTKANSLKEAIEYFTKMKQLPQKEFLKLFIVTEI